MNIEQLFDKPINRNINGVVKAEQTDDQSVFIELDEYVVTHELVRHFRNFFETYLPAVKNPDDPAIAGKIGVWVSGFFGSGKSHFIKILSYLLANQQTQHQSHPKRAVEFFKEKIEDPSLYGDIFAAVQKQTDVILFNIDSRADTEDKEDAILKVLLKVFNERLGFSGDHAHLAHLERELTKRHQYEAFKQQFARSSGLDWLKARDAFYLHRDEVAEALAHATQQSIESARQSVEHLEKNFNLDINNFCYWVKDYLTTHGQRNIVFLVDEVGQFIGQNTQMMLKLQTITEQLGVICQGKAWIIVTSQADIDAVLGNINHQQGNDFSKIQGRFYTRISLSSSNTNEVIQKRLLQKVEPAREVLSKLYAEKGHILKNQLSFDKTTTAELVNYRDSTSFIDHYPFIPYHYPLVQKIFESIRTKGATGKHLAMGERSLLDAFQTAALTIKSQPIGVLVPLHHFYASIESFLEPAVKKTIDNATELESLNPFDCDILKTLFMIRYVDTVKSTLDNLVTLTISEIDTDKISLKRAIEQSLERLERQVFIARNGDEYYFLTNEEKEIEKEIQHTDIEPAELTYHLAGIVFDNLLKRNNSYRYPVNKQDFRVSRFCNGHPRDGSKEEPLTLAIISPLDPHYTHFTREAYALQQSQESHGKVIVVLGDQKSLWDELAIYIKTDRFIKLNSGKRPQQQNLINDKALENNERLKRLGHQFGDLFQEARFYSVGSAIIPKASEPLKQVEECYHYLIANTFTHMALLHPPTPEIKREIQSILSADDVAQLGVDPNDEACHPQATREVMNYMENMAATSRMVTVETLLNHFTARPYGWLHDEIVLITVRQVLLGQLNLIHQGRELPLKQSYDLLTSVRKQNEIQIQKVSQHSEQQLQSAYKLYKTLFNKTFTGSGEKEFAQQLRQQLAEWQQQLKTFNGQAQTGDYPGRATINTGLRLLAELLQAQNSFTLIENLLQQRDELEDFAEAFEDLDSFYGSQLTTWQKMVQALDIHYRANLTALERDPTAQPALQQLNTIRSDPSPYGQINKIEPLLHTLQEVNETILAEKREHGLQRMDNRLCMVSARLDEIHAPADLRNRTLYPLQQCRQRIERCHAIAEIYQHQQEAEGYEEDALEAINRYLKQQQQKPTPIQQSGDRAGDPVKPTPKGVQTQTLSVAHLYRQTMVNKTYLESADEVEQFTAVLKQKLLDELKQGKKVLIK